MWHVLDKRTSFIRLNRSSFPLTSYESMITSAEDNSVYFGEIGVSVKVSVSFLCPCEMCCLSSLSMETCERSSSGPRMCCIASTAHGQNVEVTAYIVHGTTFYSFQKHFGPQHPFYCPTLLLDSATERRRFALLYGSEDSACLVHVVSKVTNFTRQMKLI